MLPKLTGLLGIAAFIALAWGLSSDRRRFPWRAVAWGLGLQLAFATVILATPFGTHLFAWAQWIVDALNRFAMDGAKFVFGPLADRDLLAEQLGPAHAVILAISISATIIFVSSISSLLYHWGILQRVVHAMAVIMKKAMQTSGSETLSAAANVFMGQTEAPLLVKPYIADMTRSELLALMTGGMATIAGAVMAAYVSFGASSGHLLTASVMSAPAALMLAKILLPETGRSRTAHDVPLTLDRTASNSIDALCRGASEGVALSLNVVGMLIAFVALVALVNYLLAAPQTALGIASPVTLERLFGWLNAPCAWLMGVPARDCAFIGQVLGERIVLNEFIGYLSLTGARADIDPRSFTLATYALCGFANFGSIAIQIGGIGSLAPNRRGDLAALGLKAMLGGLLASYLTASIAGLLI